MATAQLGSFTYDMLLNTAKFEASLTAAQASAAKTGETIRAQIQSSVNGLTNSLGNLAGVLVGAFSVEKLFEFGKTAISVADQLEKMSQKLGISVENLSALQAIAITTSVPIEDLQGGLDKLSKNLTAAAGGAKQQQAAFQALGIATKDATGNVRPLQDVFAELAVKMASYNASAVKNADAQALMGKGASALIPLLNQLGTEGFAGAQKYAAQFGAVISTDTAEQASKFENSLAALGLEAKGFANAVVTDLLPGLNKIASSMVDAGKTTDNYAGSASVVATAVKIVIATLITASDLISGFATSTFAFFDAVKTVFTSAGEVISAWSTAAVADVKAAFTFDGSGLAQTQATLQARLSAITKTFDSSMASIKSGLVGGVGDAITNSQNAWTALFGAIDKTGNSATATGAKIGGMNAPLIANANAASALEKAQKKLSDMFAKDAQAIADAGAKLDPVAKIYQEYVKSIEAAVKAYDDEIALINKFNLGSDKAAQALQNLTDKRNADYAALQAEIAAQVKQNDVVGIYLAKLAAETATVGLTEREQAQQKAIDELTISWNKLTDSQKAQEIAAGKLDPTNDANKASIEGVVGALYDQKKAAEAATEAAKEWQSIWVTAGDGVASTFAKVLVEGGSLFNGLKDLAKQTVEAIIQYFLKLAVINPILNSIFGGQSGFSMLPSLFGGGSSGGGISSLFSGGGSGNIFSSLFGGGAASALSASQSTGIFADIGDNGAGALSAAQSSGVLAGDVGNVGAGFTDWGSIASSGEPTFTDWGTSLGDSAGTSFLGKAVPILGGIIAGIGEFKAAGGGIGGLAGGAAYGIGTASLAVGAGAALSGGLAVGLAAIGPIGWVALAAMAVNIISGGKLFGTAGKLNSSQSTLTVGSSGATVDESYTLKGQKAFFGGTKYTTKSLTPDAAAVAAANAFFDSLQKNTDQFAKQFNAKVGTLIGGSFQQTFDKKGKATGTTSTVLGQTYSGETQDQFAQRLIDENDLVVLDTFDSKLSAMLDTFRASADTLTQVTTGLASGEMALQGGEHFLALGTDQSLSALLKLAEGMQGAGETIDQTFARIEQAQQQYDQFVAQFAKAATFVDPYEKALSGLYDQEKAAIAQANALAKAAGAAGANTSDLTNIMSAYAQQMSDLTVQTEQAAQSLAFSLGLTTQGTLDQVNQAISDLTGNSNGAASNISNFGNAIQKTSQKAVDAMNLLLGDLSPLNDQQKLQTALQGLRAGTVTAEQVLTIGRQLYASSEAYTQLFNEVKQYNKSATGTKAGGGHGGGSSTVTSADGFTAADLPALYAQRDALQKAQTLSQFQTLAQQVAELATAKGEDYTAVLNELGIKQADLEKGLGIKSDADLAAYISQIQQQTDSAGQNTTSIVSAIVALPTQIAAALSGSLTSINVPTGPGGVRLPPSGSGATVNPGSVTNTNGAGSPTPVNGPGTGPRLPGAPSLTQQIAEGVSAGVAPIAAKIASGNRSNLRWATASVN